MIVYKDFALQA